MTTPTAGRAEEAAADAEGAGPQTPRSTLARQGGPFAPTPTTAGAGSAHSTPESSSAASLSSAADGTAPPAAKRRLLGLGRKLRSALSDLLVAK
jgi:hypothetical protein